MQAKIDDITREAANCFCIDISIPFTRKDYNWRGKETIIQGDYLHSFRVKKLKDVEAALKAFLISKVKMEALKGTIIKIN